MENLFNVNVDDALEVFTADASSSRNLDEYFSFADWLIFMLLVAHLLLL